MVLLKIYFVLLILSVVVTNTHNLNELRTTGVSYYVRKFKESFFKNDTNDEFDVTDLGNSTEGNENNNTQIESQADGSQTLDSKEITVSGIGNRTGVIQRRADGKKKKKKKKRGHQDYLESDSGSERSSSREFKYWGVDWEVYWNKKKMEAHKSSPPQGEVLNMAGARPWGIPCGDPNQHDMPWGTCMLPMECEAEHRIYRGDFYCGRTEFVCCGFQISTYDMYQANDDISFEGKSMSIDSNERKVDKEEEQEKRIQHHDKHKRKRKQERLKRKRKIKRRIKDIVKEMEVFLDKMFRNHTKNQIKKTHILKKFVNRLKKQFRKDRIALQDIHNEELIRMDSGMMLKLHQLMHMNHEFASNQTFRDILINGTINKNQARMLVEANPDIFKYLPAKLRTNDVKHKRHLDFRQSASGIGRRKNFPSRRSIHFPYIDYTDYDVEYGYLYY